MAISTVEDLRDHLGKTLEELDKNKITPEHANSVSKVADSIMQTVRTEIEYNKSLGTHPNIKYLNKSVGNAVKRINVK